MEDATWNRRVCAVLWIVILGLAIASRFHIQLTLFAWGSALVMLFVTAFIAKLSRDERLVHPIAYRVTAGALLVVCLAGMVFGAMSDAHDVSRVFAVYFGLLAFMAYRSLIAKSPRAAMFTVAIASVLWVPFVFVTLIGCRRYSIERIPHWTEIASPTAMRVALYMLPVLAASALLSWTRRDDFVPDARAIKA